MLLLRLLGAFAAFNHVSAQTQTNAVQLFIHNMDPEAQWAASIQNACSGSTTYVISCTSAPMNNACSPQVSSDIQFAIFCNISATDVSSRLRLSLRPPTFTSSPRQQSTPRPARLSQRRVLWILPLHQLRARLQLWQANTETTFLRLSASICE